MIVGLLLAAGGARRFGAQKLTRPLRGQPLVRHAANALGQTLDALVAVVGHDAERVRAALVGVPCTVVENADWATGLASSVRAGIAALPANADAVVIALGDQPDIDTRVIRSMVECWHATSKPIVAARYRGTRGHPVLFDRAVFAELAVLEDDVGAKPVIDRDAARVAYADVDSEIPRDVDTAADLDALAD